MTNSNTGSTKPIRTISMMVNDKETQTTFAQVFAGPPGQDGEVKGLYLPSQIIYVHPNAQVPEGFIDVASTGNTISAQQYPELVGILPFSKEPDSEVLGDIEVQITVDNVESFVFSDRYDAGGGLITGSSDDPLSLPEDTVYNVSEEAWADQTVEWAFKIPFKVTSVELIGDGTAQQIGLTYGIKANSEENWVDAERDYFNYAEGNQTLNTVDESANGTGFRIAFKSNQPAKFTGVKLYGYPVTIVPGQISDTELMFDSNIGNGFYGMKTLMYVGTVNEVDVA